MYTPGTQPGPVLPVFRTGSLLIKTLCLDRQKFLRRFFNVDFLGVITKYFPKKPSSKTQLKCILPFLTHQAINCSWYKDLKQMSSKIWMGRNLENWYFGQAFLKFWLGPWYRSLIWNHFCPGPRPKVFTSQRFHCTFE